MVATSSSGQKLFAGERRRSFHGCERGEVPDASQIGLGPMLFEARVSRTAGGYPTRFLAKRGTRYRVIPDKTYVFASEGGLTKLQTIDEYHWMQPTLTDSGKPVSIPRASAGSPAPQSSIWTRWKR